MTDSIDFDVPDLAATWRLAGALANLARPGDVIGLSGELGCGKTTFSRAFIAGVAGGEVEVPSPTFNLVLTYPTPRAPIWHFDLYRIERAGDLDELGLEQAFAEGISLIEWPERLGGRWPADGLWIAITANDDGSEKRHFRLQGGGDWPRRLAQATAPSLGHA
jgi:tRNA threonylcarbamoyladenosine biosynthesis protein TsaE